MGEKEENAWNTETAELFSEHKLRSCFFCWFCLSIDEFYRCYIDTVRKVFLSHKKYNHSERQPIMESDGRMYVHLNGLMMNAQNFRIGRYLRPDTQSNRNNNNKK